LIVLRKNSLSKIASLLSFATDRELLQLEVIEKFPLPVYWLGTARHPSLRTFDAPTREGRIEAASRNQLH
jgi:hypothetical protein